MSVGLVTLNWCKNFLEINTLIVLSCENENILFMISNNFLSLSSWLVKQTSELESARTEIPCLPLITYFAIIKTTVVKCSTSNIMRDSELQCRLSSSLLHYTSSCWKSRMQWNQGVVFNCSCMTNVSFDVCTEGWCCNSLPNDVSDRAFDGQV